MQAPGKNRFMQGSNGDGRATRNLLLDALSAEERDQLLDGAAVRPIEVGDTWRRPGDTVTSVVFPTSGVLSMLADTGDSTLESATVGREGAADVFAAIASRMAPQLLISQVSGQAYEVPVDTFDKVFTSSPRVGKVIYGYIEALLVQTSMSAACIAAHDLSERCARWLLQTHDRVDSDDFDLKQEFLADMLGVRRPSVSIAAGTLQAAGLISYTRGRISVVDREGLEEAACNCYELVRLAYSRLVPLV